MKLFSRTKKVEALPIPAKLSPLFQSTLTLCDFEDWARKNQWLLTATRTQSDAPTTVEEEREYLLPSGSFKYVFVNRESQVDFWTF